MTVGAIATGVGAVASIGSSLFGGKANKKANTQAQNLQSQNLQAQQQYAQQARDANVPMINAATQRALGYAAPYQNLGQRAGDVLSQSLGLSADETGRITNPMSRQFTSQDYQDSTNYTPLVSNQFTQDQYAAMKGPPEMVSNTLTANEWRDDGSGTYTAAPTTLEELQKTPGYQFQLQQGQQAINNSAAAKGNLLSGASAAALNNFAQGQAGTYFQQAWQNGQQAYQNAFARKNQRFQQGQQGFQQAFNNNAQQYQQGQNALNQSQQNFTNNQKQQYDMLRGLNSQGAGMAQNMGNYETSGANAVAAQNNQYAQAAGGANNNYANNSGSLALAQGQQNANMYTQAGNAITGLAGRYLSSNNTALGGKTGGGGGGGGNY